MSAFLPQFDPDPVARARHLEQVRRHFQFNYRFVSPLAVIERVPHHHEFSHEWLIEVGHRVVTVLANRLELEGETHFADYLRAKHGLLGKLLDRSAIMFIGLLKEIVTEALRFTGRASALSHRPDDLEAYAKLFRGIGLPPVAATSHTDEGFAQMRIAGPNPVMIQRIDAPDDRFPVTEAIFQEVIPGDSLAAAGAEGRLFLIDYHILDGAELGAYPEGVQKYVYAPLALFVVDKTDRRLRPVAIQCKQRPRADNPIFTPDDGFNWRIAKTIVEVADGNMHEAFTHLGRTHLLIEPFVISTYRQLDVSHPLFQLLVPHFEGTLAINDAAWRHLIANKGAVDKLFGSSILASRKLVVTAVQKCDFNEAMLPKSLTTRGVMDRTWLHSYPYRDDSALYWDAIKHWVGEYLGLFYKNDADIVADTELNAWLHEIGANDGGRISGVGTGSAPTLAYLIDAVTMLIHTSSVQHAAVNFPQYDLMSYVPNMPLASFTPAPSQKKGGTQADHINMLPPLDLAELQMELGYMLGSVHYTSLGKYAEGHFPDPRVAEPLARFQERVATIGQTIERRNESRPPYAFLLPAGIPQSINI